MSAKLASLIARLEAAPAGSRKLDHEIMALQYRWERRHIGATCWAIPGDVCCPGAKHLDWVWVDPTDDRWKTTAIDGFEFTTSVDAALALLNRVLPGWIWCVAYDDQLPEIEAYRVWVTNDRKMLVENPLQSIGGRTPALALCAAILRAKGGEQ